MKIISREKVENYSLPLPLYKSIKIADAIGKDGAEFDLLLGLDEKYAQDLRERAKDEQDADLQNFTSDKKRFVTGTYEYWYKKCRTIFALVHKPTDSLAAVVWFGPKPIGKKSPKFSHVLEEKKGDERKPEDEWHTVSYRCYPQYRGKGMMKNFTSYAMSVYKKHFPHVKFWAGMDDRNTASMRLLEGLNFSIDGAHSDIPEHWLIMTKV